MYYKISPLIIILLVAVIILIVGFGITILVEKKDSSNDVIKQDISEIVPTLELNVNTNDENQEFVEIIAFAKTDDESGIYSIILPDGKVVRSDIATYIANANGNYTFKVKGNNGQSSSLTFEVNNIRQPSSSNPYIPTGFFHKEGDVDSGYVVQDQFGNEFVWVPVPNGKLTRNTMLETNYEELNVTSSELVNSVAQNYGFYIAKYEASPYKINGEYIACSIGNQTPWTNIKYTDALMVCTKANYYFDYGEYKTTLMNSYAWDTTLAWIDKTFENYATNTSYGNYSGNIRKTGTTETDKKNNICDMAGNVREWTTEIFKNNSLQTSNAEYWETEKVETNSETITYRVIRGGSANLSRTAASHTGYKENLTDMYWGFRMILYK